MLKNLILLGLVLGFSSMGHANVSEQYSMIPLRNEIRIKQGETREVIIKVRNDMKKAKMTNYFLSIQEFILTDTGSLDAKPKTKNTRSLVPFSKISNPTFPTIEPGQEVSVKITISIPKDYKYGSGFLTYKLFKEDSLKTKSKGAVGFMKNIYGFIAVNVPENETKDIKINSANYKNSRLDIEIENIGESYLKTSSKIVLLDGEKKVGIFDLVDDKNRKEFLNIPGVKRVVKAIIPEANVKQYKNLRVNVIVSDVSSSYVKSESLSLKKK